MLSEIYETEHEPKRVMLDNYSRHTGENAENIKRKLEELKDIEGDVNLCLITEATHLTRALMTSYAKINIPGINIYGIWSEGKDFNSINEFNEFAKNELKKYKEYIQKGDMKDIEITDTIYLKEYLEEGPCIYDENGNILINTKKVQSQNSNVELSEK